jgi:hypothetical protein
VSFHSSEGPATSHSGEYRERAWLPRLQLHPPFHERIQPRFRRASPSLHMGKDAGCATNPIVKRLLPIRRN